ncbi:class I SAM-dependent methyltransferase [Acidobacteria bacterium AH-259-D05]|nr:class I SAM-dependent methyltransferase [Acidobacteria bacterium AH-259-D05]
MDYRKIDFDEELDIGPETYNGTLGKWWLNQSSDTAHGYAYRKIIGHVHSLLRRPPKRIIDYTCGAGNMLTRLYRLFSDSQLTGIDGSSFLLQQAKRRMQLLGRNWENRVELIETHLPDFSLPSGKADMCLFVFPNIVPDPSDDVEEDHDFPAADLAVADYLSRVREPDPEEETVEDDPETVYDSLLTDNVVARNLRGLLKKGGLCVRADYANAPREELTRLVQQRMAFQEASLEVTVNGFRVEQLFAVVDSIYCRSKVLEDVYHQTRDESDKEGGYLITTLRAI